MSTEHPSRLQCMACVVYVTNVGDTVATPIFLNNPNNNTPFNRGFRSVERFSFDADPAPPGQIVLKPEAGAQINPFECIFDVKPESDLEAQLQVECASQYYFDVASQEWWIVLITTTCEVQERSGSASIDATVMVKVHRIN